MAHLVFHVRHNARPALVREVLELLAIEKPRSLDDMLRMGAERGYQIGTAVRSAQSLSENPIQTARDLGLIDSAELNLTNLGWASARLVERKPNAFGEILHFLFYTRWTPLQPDENCFSWSYRTVSDLLWEAGSGSIDRARIVTRVSELAMDRFHTTKVSFSKDSVRGVLQWLAGLEPPVLELDGKGFARRNFCPPETFVLAMDHLYQMERADYQTNLLLDTEKQHAVCRLCLLEPTSFDAVLDWAAGQYPFLRRGGSGGWGSYVVLTAQPLLQDLVG